MHQGPLLLGVPPFCSAIWPEGLCFHTSKDQAVRFEKKSPLKSDKKVPPKTPKKGVVGYNKKSALLEDAITQMNAGKYGRASSVLKELLALDPQNAEARRLFATLHLRLGSLLSARTAFEALAREAMERQDYWLAESLLREYLAAGPRCVPFLEMLGNVYEAKGDVMAAVAEYGKAVEVLLEDPDSERPTHAGDLYERIRSLAAGSPVAFRLAAMFDSVTGQALPPTAQALVPATDANGDIAVQATDNQADHAEAVPLVEATEDLSLPSPTEPVATVLPEEALAKVDPSPVAMESMGASAQLPSADSEPMVAEQPIDPPFPAQDHVEDQPVEVSVPVVEAVSAVPEPPSIPVADLPDAPATVLEPAQESTVVPFTIQREPSQQPIATPSSTPGPMPWDQVEEASPMPPPQAERTPPTATGAGDQPVPEVTSSGLTWDEILAAVAAMKSSAEPAQPEMTHESEPSAVTVQASEAGPEPEFKILEGSQAPDSASSVVVPEPAAASVSVETTADGFRILDEEDRSRVEEPAGPIVEPAAEAVPETIPEQSSAGEPAVSLEFIERVEAETPVPAEPEPEPELSVPETRETEAMIHLEPVAPADPVAPIETPLEVEEEPIAISVPSITEESMPATLTLERSTQEVISNEMPSSAEAEPTASKPESDAGLHILWDAYRSAPLLEQTESVTSAPPLAVEQASAEVSEAAVSAEAPSGERPELVAISATDVSEAVTAQPAKHGAGAARRIGEALATVVRTGFSTTRSMVLLSLTLVGFVVAVTLCGIGGLAATWFFLEEQPSAAYRAMTAVPQRILQEPHKNGYFLLLGFGAASSQDAVQAGLDRRVEDADQALAEACLSGEGSASSRAGGSANGTMTTWWKGSDPAAQMRTAAADVKSWASAADVSLARYRQWLTMPFEDWGYGQAISPNCGLILQAHRLYLAEGFAQDPDTGLARLETDAAAWRTVLGHAKTLPVKLLASDALNEDLAVASGLLLRPDLEDRQISRLAKLARPLEQAELSIRWPMQSRLVLAAQTIDEEVAQDKKGGRPLYASIAAALPLPKQRRLNAYAEYYEAAEKAAAEGRVADLPKPAQFVRTSPYGLADVVVNPIEGVIGLDPLPTWDTFAGRIWETEARLRLTSLQAWLRRTPPEQELLARLAKAGQGHYDPFTGFPMLVHLKKGLLYSVGRDLKDNEAQDHADVVVQIPPSAWTGAKRAGDSAKGK